MPWAHRLIEVIIDRVLPFSSLARLHLPSHTSDCYCTAFAWGEKETKHLLQQVNRSLAFGLILFVRKRQSDTSPSQPYYLARGRRRGISDHKPPQCRPQDQSHRATVALHAAAVLFPRRRRSPFTACVGEAFALYAMAPPAAIDVLPESDISTFTVPDRLTIQGIAKRRAVEGRLIAGVAALADVESFKGRTAHLHKARAKRWDCKLLQVPRSADWLLSTSLHQDGG